MKALSTEIDARLETGATLDRILAGLEMEIGAKLGSAAPAWMHEAAAQGIRAGIRAAKVRQRWADKRARPSQLEPQRAPQVAEREDIQPQQPTAADVQLTAQDRLMMAADFVGETDLLTRRMSSGKRLGDARRNDLVIEYNKIADVELKANGYRRLLSAIAKTMSEAATSRRVRVESLTVREVLSDREIRRMADQIGRKQVAA